MIDKVFAHIDANKESYLKRLFDFLRSASISTDPEKKAETRKCGEWVLKLFADAGIRAEMIDTAGHPAILADSGSGSGKAAVLVYGHYDVQPVGDESLWKSPAFEPTVREGNIYARGSADDKGQVLAHLLAAEAWMKVAGKLPARVKFLVEGEEEIGSPNLEKLVDAQKERLSCQYVALSDTPKFNSDIPAITLSTRGLVYKEVIITGPKQNLHSGSYGGTLLNPGNALAALIASFHDANGRVTIPHFYDDVRELTAIEKEKMQKLPFDEKGYLAAMGAPSLVGEKGFTTMERRSVRPTLDINGLMGGFTGAGASTVIPAKVMAKVSMRIVPNQKRERISQLFDDYVRSKVPSDVKLEIHTHSTADPYVAQLDSPGMRAAERAMTVGFGQAPVYIREGGTLPILPMFRRVLGAESLMIGLCHPDCNAHGPNEFFAVDDFYRGIRTAAQFMHEMAAAG